MVSIQRAEKLSADLQFAYKDLRLDLDFHVMSLMLGLSLASTILGIWLDLDLLQRTWKQLCFKVFLTPEYSQNMCTTHFALKSC